MTKEKTPERVTLTQREILDLARRAIELELAANYQNLQRSARITDADFVESAQHWYKSEITRLNETLAAIDKMRKGEW